ncbi:MAG: methyltransferase domain-containing protein [Candidatus Omnitrophica bacterium]|nr:methyltransferase domain-containing protein [Candidatus Omnitrophota bacterium]
MAKEFKYFKNGYFEEIKTNYFAPILDDVFSRYGSGISRVADVGCGNGLFTAYLKEKRQISLTGFDASEHALKIALEKGFDKAILCEDFSTQALNAQDCSFDFILNKDVLEHLLDPDFLLSEIERVLKPDGLFLLHVPVDFNIWRRIKFVFTGNIDTYNHAITNCPGAREWNWPHIRFFTFRGVSDLLAAHHFHIVKNYSAYFTDSVPVLHRIPGFMRVVKAFSERYPSQLCQGITLLTRKT